MENTQRTRYLLTKIEKQLIKLNIGLKGLVEFEDDLKAVFKNIDELSKLSSDSKNARRVVEERVSSEAMISLFKEVRDNYYESKQVLDKYQDFIENADLYFEKFRDYRYYDFKTNLDYFQFVEKVCDTLNAKEAWVKPEIAGVLKFSELAKKLNLKQEGNMFFKVPVKDLKPLFEAVLAQNPNSGLRVEVYPATIVWRPQNYVRVDVSPDYLDKIDRIARDLNAGFMPV